MRFVSIVKELEPINIPKALVYMYEKKSTWDEAQHIIENQGAPWRMPTMHEVQAWGPQIRSKFGGNEFIWTKTRARGRNYFWVVNPQNGATALYDRGSLCSVLSVNCSEQFPAQQRRWEDNYKGDV